MENEELRKIAIERISKAHDSLLEEESEIEADKALLWFIRKLGYTDVAEEWESMRRTWIWDE